MPVITKRIPSLLAITKLPVQYELSPLLPPPGATWCGARAVNESLIVAGSALVGTELRAVYWDHGGAHLLPKPSWITDSAAMDINSAGAIVGTGHFSDEHGKRHTVALAWPTPDDVIVLRGPPSKRAPSLVTTPPTLGAPPVEYASEAWAINDAGEIVGGLFHDLTDTNEHPCRWNAIDAAPLDLGTVDSPFGVALGINRYGVAVGWSAASLSPYPGFKYHAFKADRSTPAVALPPLQVPNAIPSAAGAAAVASNEAQVVGNMETFDRTTYSQSFCGVLWQGNRVEPLGLPSGSRTIVSDINAKGTIVGLGPCQPALGAVVWRGGTMTDLTLATGLRGWSLDCAYGVNDDGVIVGYASDPARAGVGFILFPKYP